MTCVLVKASHAGSKRGCAALPCMLVLGLLGVVLLQCCCGLLFQCICGCVFWAGVFSHKGRARSPQRVDFSTLYTVSSHPHASGWVFFVAVCAACAHRACEHGCLLYNRALYQAGWHSSAHSLHMGPAWAACKSLHCNIHAVCILGYAQPVLMCCNIMCLGCWRAY